jgi:hypothetical protein
MGDEAVFRAERFRQCREERSEKEVQGDGGGLKCAVKPQQGRPRKGEKSEGGRWSSLRWDATTLGTV